MRIAAALCYEQFPKINLVDDQLILRKATPCSHHSNGIEEHWGQTSVFFYAI